MKKYYHPNYSHLNLAKSIALGGAPFLTTGSVLKLASKLMGVTTVSHIDVNDWVNVAVGIGSAMEVLAGGIVVESDCYRFLRPLRHPLKFVKNKIARQLQPV